MIISQLVLINNIKKMRKYNLETLARYLLDVPASMCLRRRSVFEQSHVHARLNARTFNAIKQLEYDCFHFDN